MTIETATDPKDDFEGAFATFATPGAEVDKNAAPAAAATSGDSTDTGAATGGTDGSGDAGDAAGGGDSGAVGTAAGGDGGAGADEGAAAPAAAEEGKKAPAADDAGAADGKGGAAPAGDAGAAPAAAASDDKSAQEVLDRLSKLVAEAKPAAEEKKPAEEQATYSEDEQKRLTEYDKDWKEVAECEALRRRGEYKELLGFVFGEVQKAMAPIQQTVDALAGRTHLADVKAAVGDYNDNLRQQVIDWVVKQPAYLQPAYNHVIENGTADEVKDLVDRYRQASGLAVPAAGAATTGQAGRDPAKDNELSGAAKEAAAALAPVESKRSEVRAPGDPSSFEDAWSQFAKDLA